MPVMHRLNAKQRQMLIEMARSLEDTSSTLEKHAGRLARYGAMPRFVRALIVTAQTVLDDASAGLVEWADGVLDDDGRDTEEHTETIELELPAENVAEDDAGN